MLEIQPVTGAVGMNKRKAQTQPAAASNAKAAKTTNTAASANTAAGSVAPAAGAAAAASQAGRRNAMDPPPRLAGPMPQRIFYAVATDQHDQKGGTSGGGGAGGGGGAASEVVAAKLDNLSLLLAVHLDAVAAWRAKAGRSLKPRLEDCLGAEDRKLLAACNPGREYLSWAVTLTQQWRRNMPASVDAAGIEVRLAPYHASLHKRYMDQRSKAGLTANSRPNTRAGALPHTFGLMATTNGPISEYVQFHGTPKPSVVDVILRDGFVPSTRDDLWHGPGVYLATEPRYSHNLDFNGTSKHRILIGAIAIAHQGEAFENMLCVADTRRVLPFCTLHYSIK